MTEANQEGMLLGIIVVALLYFAPAILAFMRAHRRFWVILALNVIGPWIQSIVLQLWGLLPLQPATLPEALHALVMLLGPVWLVLLVWALAPQVNSDPKLKAWRETKLFDFFAALPLIIWFAYNVLVMRPRLTALANQMLAGEADLLAWLLFFSLLFSALFCLISVYLLVIRDKPVLRVQGALPRIAAVTGTFLGVGMLQLQVADLGLPLQGLAFLLTGVGSAASAAVLWRLGKSFSIMPEARTLVTSGPYDYVRHPLYAAEIVTVFGMILQYQQPWALVMGGGVILFQVIRSLYEENVLARAFPEYEAYRARTKRFIPGII